MSRLGGDLAAAVFGLAGGLAVGSGLVAFLAVLNVIPRLAQVTRSAKFVLAYEGAVTAGALFFTVTDLMDVKLALFPAGTAFVGLLAGVFVGMVAAALTEVLNVFPILAKRLRVEGYIVWLLMAMVLGKVAGSLFDWLVYQH